MIRNGSTTITKIRTMLIALVFIFTHYTHAKPQDLHFPFSPQTSDYWQFISDRTMGGVSNGKAAFGRENEVEFVRLTGKVSTQNNGGFIQLRAGISFANTQTLGQSISGARLTARGNGEVYHVFIRTKDTRSYSDYYYATFIASKDWQIIDLPFKDFKRSRSTGSLLLAKDIVRFAIVGYGRDFDADVSVSNITFYY
ncbi:MAG: CIA30 family protein [Oceanospirillaceae bacterium]|nr:CIA30 family protein [Oceanospirillaceae bacterium]